MSAAGRPWWLRAYPRTWRDRYGDELVATVEDAHPGPVPRSVRMDLVRAGLGQRARAVGVRRSSDPSTQTRDGSLLILWGWALFVVAGCVFAKFAEHWDAFTPGDQHAVPAAAYSAVWLAALLGGLLVVAATLVALPSFVRSMRAGGWSDVARPVLRAVGVMAVTVGAGVALAVWAHRLSSPARNGGSALFSVAALAVAALVVASVLVGAAAAAACARLVELPAGRLRLLGRLAQVAVVCMVVIAGGVVIWWAALVSSAPGFLADGPTAVAGSPYPPALVGAVVVMTAGLAVAAVGAVAVTRGRARLAT